MGSIPPLPGLAVPRRGVKKADRQPTRGPEDRFGSGPDVGGRPDVNAGVRKLDTPTAVRSGARRVMLAATLPSGAARAAGHRSHGRHLWRSKAPKAPPLTGGPVRAPWASSRRARQAIQPHCPCERCCRVGLPPRQSGSGGCRCAPRCREPTLPTNAQTVPATAGPRGRRRSPATSRPGRWPHP